MSRRWRGLGFRLLGAGCLAGVAVTHATEIAHKLEHAPYVGVLFGALIVGSLGLALLLLADAAARLAWVAAGALALSAMGAYVVSRTVGLPRLEDHVGHWLDPMGAAALLFEAVLVTLAVGYFDGWRSPRRAAPVVAVGMLLFSAGAAAQEAVAPPARLAGHSHSHAGAGAGHRHAEFPDVERAGAADLTEARELLRRVHTAAQTRFASYAAASAAGFERFRGRGWTRPLAFHMRHAGYANDARVLDPTRPESLVYWWPARGRPQLVAMMFRAAANETKESGPSLLMWHQHANPRTKELGATAMTHVWLTSDLRSAFASCLPVAALEQADPAFRYSDPRSAQAEESRPCKTS